MVKPKPFYYQTAAFLITVTLTILILVAGRSFLIPIALAMLFSFLLLPVSRFLEQKGMNRAIAIIISILVLLITIAGIGFFLYQQVATFAEDGPLLKEKLNEKIVELQKFVYRNYKVTRGEQNRWFHEQTNALLDSSGKYITDFFAFTGNILAAFSLMPIYIFFMTLYRDKIKVFLCKVTPTVHNDHVLAVARKTAKVSQLYMQGLLIDIGILAVLNSIGFLLLGIPYAILLGIIVAILNLVPYIGVLIGSILPFMMALLIQDSSTAAFGAIGVCLLVQFIDNNFLTPKIVGSSVSINPLATLLAIIAGGLLWGLVGMMLFIPLLGMAKVILDSFPQSQPLGYLIGEEEKMKKPVKTASPPKIILLNK
jgi:predicted PurR-regulated permease PerM